MQAKHLRCLIRCCHALADRAIAPCAFWYMLIVRMAATPDALVHALRQHFGITAFRPGQREALERVAALAPAAETRIVAGHYRPEDQAETARAVAAWLDSD